jgi:hypothetical protein
MIHRPCARLWAIARLGAGRLLPGDEHGQATAEYVLIVLAAGLLAMGVVAWARTSHALPDLFESVIEKLQP